MSRSTNTTRNTRKARSTRGTRTTDTAVSTSASRQATSPVTATPASSGKRRSYSDGGAARRTIGPVVEKAVRRSRRLQHYTFQFNREDTRTAGCNSVRIVSNNGSVQEFTLAEARSLYNFLADQFAGV